MSRRSCRVIRCNHSEYTSGKEHGHQMETACSHQDIGMWRVLGKSCYYPHQWSTTWNMQDEMGWSWGPGVARMVLPASFSRSFHSHADCRIRFCACTWPLCAKSDLARDS